MNDQNSSYARLRNTATGALAALAAVGVIAGTGALAANPRADGHGHAAVANGSTKTPTPPVPGKTHTSQPAVSPQPFLNAIEQLVDTGTISTTEGQVVDREILGGTVDADTVASSGFTPIQLQAVEQALGDAKRALAPGVTGVPSTPKEPPPAGTGAPSGRKEPPPAAPGNKSTPK